MYWERLPLPPATVGYPLGWVREHWRETLLLSLSIPILLWIVRLGPIAQDPSYHHFADQRNLLGLPHFWNVISNFPFAIIGFLGCRFVLRAAPTSGAFEHSWERIAYFSFFLGELATFFASSYYHSEPNNRTLVWDRAAFSILPVSFFVIAITERVHRHCGRILLLPLVSIALAGVYYWDRSELAGHGDLRLYALTVLYPVAVTPFILMLFASRYTGSRAVVWVWALYALAKLCEFFDMQVYVLTGFWSGHTLKHLTAAAATYVLLAGLEGRKVRAADALATS